jgi:hypothetical protein
MKVTIFCRRQKDGGQDFHARYLLTERGGIAVDAGFSAEGDHQTTGYAPDELRALAGEAQDIRPWGNPLRSR